MDGLLQKTFTFDATNMLSKVVDSNKGEVENEYNGLGFRVASTRPEEKIEYLCDLSRDYYNLLERTVNGETESFIYDNNVVSMSKSGNNYYYLQDELGSPMYMTGTDGVAVSSYAFDDFGRNIDPRTGKLRKHEYTTDGNIIQPFAFTGYQEDEVSGLKFAQARFYDANTGRFQSEDNVKGFIESPFTLNHYVYCWGNPVGLVDRDGNLPTFVNNIGEFISENKEQIVGTSISVVGVVAGIAATAVLTPMLGPAGPVVGGMIGGAISGGLQSVGQQMAAGGVNNISAKEVVIDIIAGGIGGAIGGIGASGFTARAGKTLIGASIDGIAEVTKSFADDGHITKDELCSAMKTAGASMIFGAAAEGISCARTRRINKKNLTPDSVSEKLLDELDDSLDGNGKVTKLKDKINTKKTKITADEYWAEHGATKKARSRAATAVKRYRKQLEAAEEKLWNLREGKWRERLIFKQEYITTPLIVNNIKNIYELCQED